MEREEIETEKQRGTRRTKEVFYICGIYGSAGISKHISVARELYEP